MPVKRKRTSGGSVTGGSGDVKPQYITAQTPIPAGVDDYSVTEILLPSIILNQPGDATVVEILRVDYYLATRDIGDTAHEDWGFLSTIASRATNETSNLSTFGADLGNPINFACVMKSIIIATSGGTVETMPLTINTTDDNGNGILVATNRMFFITGNVNGGAASESAVKILYRMTNVDMVEYVGIVTSQGSN